MSCALLGLLAGAGYLGFKDALADAIDDWNKGLPRQYKSKWLVSDGRRPKPTVVSAGKDAGAPPSDAVVLFDGKDLSKWRKAGRGPEKDWKAAEWKVENGYFEMTPTGTISTREKFGDCQLHIEWRAPSPPEKSDQARGNSGVFFMDRYELQVLDNYNNPTYSDGYAGSVYAQHPPMVNACRPPGEWQVYDIVWRAPRWKDKKLVEPARITVFHNGVLVQYDAEVYGNVMYRGLAKYDEGGHDAEEPLSLQDHGDKQPVRFRNVWIRRLDLSPEPTE